MNQNLLQFIFVLKQAKLQPFKRIVKTYTLYAVKDSYL